MGTKQKKQFVISTILALEIFEPAVKAEHSTFEWRHANNKRALTLNQRDKKQRQSGLLLTSHTKGGDNHDRDVARF